MLLLAVQNRDRTSRRKDVDREIREEGGGEGILVLVYFSTWYQDSITNKFKVHLGEVSHK